MSRMTKYSVWKVNEPEEEECALSCEASRGSVVAAPSRRQIVGWGGLLCIRRQGRWKMSVLVQGWKSAVFACYFHSEQWAHWHVLACTEVWSCWVDYRCCTYQLVIKDSALWSLKEMFLFTLMICFIPPTQLNISLAGEKTVCTPVPWDLPGWSDRFHGPPGSPGSFLCPWSPADGKEATGEGGTTQWLRFLRYHLHVAQHDKINFFDMKQCQKQFLLPLVEF